jgi:hypothetical protein
MFGFARSRCGWTAHLSVAKMAELLAWVQQRFVSALQQ